MKCAKCGAELSEGSKFCSYCGNKIGVEHSKRKDNEPQPLYRMVNSEPTYTGSSSNSTTKRTEQTFSMPITSSTTSTQKKKKNNSTNLLIALMGIIVLLLGSFLFLINSRDGKGAKETTSIVMQNQDTEPIESAEKNEDLTITKGSEYAFMTDEWNVYIATAISENIIKIENWDKSKSSDKSVSYEYDVGTYKINDKANRFTWIDADHTTFTIFFADENRGGFKEGGTATFTLNINDSDNNKGSDYSEKIACYSFQNDDWHLYRAIPLTDTFMKIETWSRSSSDDKFLYGYDFCIFDVTSGATDFEWTDDEHTAFTITLQDKENDWYWKEESLTSFMLENQEYNYFTVKSYLGRWIVGEGETAVPASASDYKYDNYEDVQQSLVSVGFTNITTEILYDIVWGWTEEGEVDSVSIDSRTDFEEGEVFKQDAPIIITYHMKEEDDPSKVTETEPPKTEPTQAPEEKEPAEVVETETANTEIFEPQVTEDKSVFYSTNDSETARQGNSGVFAYKSSGGSYSIYWIIDFDEGYVYYFTEGNGESNCDRLKIESGTLNDMVIITYHDGGEEWSNCLHFKWVNHPETLIMQDNDGFEYDYSYTNLEDALNLRSTKTIIDY